MLHHPPAEEHGVHFRWRRRSPRHDFQFGGADRFQIPFLPQKRFRSHAAKLESGTGPQRVLQNFDQAEIFFALQEGRRLGCELRSHDDFAENFGNCFCARQIERLIDGDDPAKRSLFVRGKSFLPGFAQALTLADAARIGMF